MIGLSTQEGVGLELAEGHVDERDNTLDVGIEVMILFRDFVEKGAFQTIEEAPDQKTIGVSVNRSYEWPFMKNW